MGSSQPSQGPEGEQVTMWNLIQLAEPPYSRTDVVWSEHETYSEALLAQANARLGCSHKFDIVRKVETTDNR
jgi:hypothetical protein